MNVKLFPIIILSSPLYIPPVFDQSRRKLPYPDPTAYSALKAVSKEESEIEQRAFELIKSIKTLIRLSGFETIERIKIRDVDSGKEFR